MHRTEQRRLPVVLVGAGLPQLRGQMGNAKSYAERLFDFPTVGALPPEPARLAIEQPLLGESVSITPEAMDLILQVTQGYAYFLPEGKPYVARRQAITNISTGSEARDDHSD